MTPRLPTAACALLALLACAPRTSPDAPVSRAGGLAIPQPRMGEPLHGLDARETALFEAGRDAFLREYREEEGLGPSFNDDNCQNCHREPAVGGNHLRLVTRFGKAGPPFDPLVSLGGPALHLESTHPAATELLPAESDVQVERLTPPLFGAGLVELIPDAVLHALAADSPPGISGRVHIVQPLEGGAERAGRFGWKAQIATLTSFSADALHEEMGITNRYLPHESPPNGDVDVLRATDHVADPEDRPDAEGFDAVDRLTHFQQLLAPPPQTPRSGMTGERVFDAVGCGQCHVRSFTTRLSSVAALSEVTFQPYSDFLLHDMGTLGDGIVQGDATETEMRTAPLWGLSQRTAFLHDGRAAHGTLEENLVVAITAHSGEAAAATDAFLALGSDDCSALLAFLGSLGRAEFDWDGDHDVDRDDLAALRPHLSVSGTSITPDDALAVADIDQDGDFDLEDMAAMERALGGPPD